MWTRGSNWSRSHSEEDEEEEEERWRQMSKDDSVSLTCLCPFNDSK